MIQPQSQNDRNGGYFASLEHFVPGGAHYNFRDIWLPSGLCFARGKGVTLEDLDGNIFIDFYSNFGATILGHAHQEYLATLFRHLSMISSSSMSALTLEVSQRVLRHFPGEQMVRFCLSGTEAILNAIRLARAYTKRERIVRFTGCYHGHADNILGGVPFSSSNPYPVCAATDSRFSEGVARDANERQNLLVQFNNVAELTRTLRGFSDSIACVLIEPIALNAGGLTPTPEFLSALQSLTDELGIVLIADEVITGCRIALGGAQEGLGLRPQLTVLGKALSGGLLPVSAVVGIPPIMQLFANRKVVHGGTFNGYHAGLAAVLANYEILDSKRSDNLAAAARHGSVLQDVLQESALGAGVPIVLQGHPAAFCLHLTEAPFLSAEQYSSSLRMRNFAMQKCLLRHGVLAAPPLRFYPSVTLTEAELRLFTRRVRAAFSDYAGGLEKS